MMTPAYAETLKECLIKLDLALQEAEACIPEDLLTEHWIKSKSSPAAWSDIYHAHQAKHLQHPEMITALFALWQGMGIRTAIQGILDEVKNSGRAAVLPKLGKMRR